MPATGKFEIRYVSPSIVRCQEDEFALEYEDNQGTLTFGGFESTHASGGMLYFPTSEEWDAFLPKRGGQRSKVLERLFDFASGKGSHFGYIVPSLLEPGFFSRWPKERDYLRRNPSPVAAEGLAKLILSVRYVNSTMPPPSVSRVAFDRVFQVAVLKGETIEVILLRSDRSAGHPKRCEVHFLMVEYKKLPAEFDGLTVEDVTGIETPDAEAAAVVEKWKGGARLFRLRAKDGATGHIVAVRCAFIEYDASPEAPSVFPMPK